MKKNTSKALLVATFLFSFIFALSACKNSSAPVEEITSDSCKCTIYIESPSKTATPVLPDYIWYTLIAAQEPIAPEYDDEGELKPVLEDRDSEGNYKYKKESNFTGTNYFVMDLEHNGTWYFYIEGYALDPDDPNEKRTEDKRILIGSTSGVAKGKHYNVSLKVDFLPEGNGTVNLPIDVSETNINKLKITNAGDGILNGTYNKDAVASGKIVISANNIPAGAYPATLTFYKDDVIIFRIQNETINVKDNMVTDAWIYSEHCDYLEPQGITHPTDVGTAFPPDERTITDTAVFKITRDYLHKRCNTTCYVSPSGSSENIGSNLKPFYDLQSAFKRIVALNDNFYKIDKKETFTILIDGILNDDEYTYSIPETTNPLAVNIEPEPNNTGTCESKGYLIFGENYDITIDAGATSEEAKKRFKFNTIETSSPISINNCTISGDLTFNGANSKTSTIYNSIIGTTAKPVDFTVINSKVSFINPDESLALDSRGSTTTFTIKNMNISEDSDVEIYNSASVNQAPTKITGNLKINSSAFKISHTILPVTETTEIRNCTKKVEFGVGIDFTTKYYNVYNCSNLVIDGPLEKFKASSSFYAEDSTLNVSNSSLEAGTSFTLKNCDSEFKGETYYQTKYDLTMSQFELIGGTTDIELYTFTAGSELKMSQNAELNGNMIDLGPDSDNCMDSLSFTDSKVTLVDSKVHYDEDLEIKNTNFSFINKSHRNNFYGKEAASLKITDSTAVFEYTALNFESVSSLQDYIQDPQTYEAKKKTIFTNSNITIKTPSSIEDENDTSYFRGDIFVDENTNLSFIDTRLTAGNLLVDESSEVIFSGRSKQIRADSRIYLDKNAKFYVQNPPSDKNTTVARLFDLNPIDNQSLVVLYDSNKNEIDFTSDFDDTDKRYTVENVGYKLTYNDSENKRKGMLVYDESNLKSLPTNWGARMKYVDEEKYGTGNYAIIGATAGASDAIVPDVSSYNLATAKTEEIIGGLWNNNTAWSGSQFVYVKEITYSIIYEDEVIAAKTSMDSQKSMFILSDLETDIENKLKTNNSVEYNIRMTFVWEHSKNTTFNGSYTCTIPLIVTKN